MLTLEQLTTPMTEDEALASILATLTEFGYQATSWQNGSIQLTIVRTMARLVSRLTGTVSDIAKGGFASLAATGWLTLVARYFYDLERIAAQPTVGRFTLTNSPAGPVHNWLAGDLVVADSPQGTSSANAYTVTSAGTLGPGSSISIEFKANVPGTAANIAPGATLYMWTPLVGVTVTNPIYGVGSNTWITTAGTDEESNPRLAARCLGRWARLSYGNIEGAYVAWMLEALPQVTRWNVKAAAGNGTVVAYAATPSGSVTAPQIATIQDYVNGVTDGKGRRPINDIFSVVAPAQVTSPPIVITAYVESAYVATIQSVMATALLANINAAPIGGYRLQGTTGRIIYSDLIEIANSLPGVRSVKFSITDDIILNPNEIYLPTITVNPISVAPGT